MGIEGTRRDFVRWSGAAAVAGALGAGEPARGAEKGSKPPKPKTLSDSVLRYLHRLYAEGNRKYAFRDDYPGGFAGWQKDARAVLRRLIGLDRIAALAKGHQVTVQLDPPQDQGGYIRRRGRIEPEPDITIPLWLLEPKGRGPFPLAVLPHGHSSRGFDTYAGIYHSERDRRRALSEDRDVAVQAVKRGFVAIAPAVRGLAVDGVPDASGRHGDRDCRSHVMHCLLAGRTAIGERVWDMQRIIDWASVRSGVDAKCVLMMGNSGGGMVTIYTAACDVRVTIAVPSCSFGMFVTPEGRISHCDCNVVPGIFELGEFYDVAGLIAPRHLLTVNGRKDALFTVADVDRAAERVRRIYRAAGHPERYEHRWGSAGHRFYKALTWPFIENVSGRNS